MPASRKLSGWSSWQPDEYYQDYYSEVVHPDEQIALRFQIEFLQRARRRFPRALEYGCGPTLMRAIATAKYVESLDMADRLPRNLRQVQQWKTGKKNANDWNHFTEYLLQSEGIARPSRRQIRAREQRTRKVLRELLATDARQPYPLGPARVGTYDLLVSGFCLDCLSPSQAVWRRCTRHVLRLLRPGGSFVFAAFLRCPGYSVGERWFPGANLSRGDWQAGLVHSGASPAALKIAVHKAPAQARAEYRGILLACGQTVAAS
ncbi:MAG TPA: guanitoxin biosynthesis pre-guanitoxin forming N-methyltransferase GntF [Gemmataceae bacterium]